MATPIRESLSSAAEKLQQIVEAAEEAARAIQVEAEEEALRYREERRREADALVAEHAERLKELSTSLSEHADRVRSAVLSLSAELNRAADELRGDTAPATERPPGEDGGDASEGPDRPRPGWFRGQVDTRQRVPYPGTGTGPAVNRLAGPAGSEDASSAAAGPDDAPIPDEALLRATQMAVAGRSREEIEEALRRDFALADPGAVVDDISRPRRGELGR